MVKWSPQLRLAVLQEADVSGNIVATCNKYKMDRATFYKLRRRVAGLPPEQWLAALEDRSKRWKSHGQQTTEEARKRIIKTSLQYPSWGCGRIQQRLERKGIRRSANTIQNILRAEGIGKIADRARVLDTPGAKLSQAQRTVVERFNPSYRERNRRGNQPGARVHVGTVDLGKLPGIGPLVLFVGIDTHSSYAFGAIRRKRSAPSAESVLSKMMIPELRKSVTKKIWMIVSPRRDEYDGGYGAILKKASIKHLRRTSDGKTSGFIEKFADSVMKDFMPSKNKLDIDDDIKTLQRDFRAWRAKYNETPLEGFPNYGKSPSKIFGRSKK